MLDALAAADLLRDDPSDGNALAGRIEKLCTGKAYETIRAMARAFKASKDVDIRRVLAGRLYDQLDLITAGWPKPAIDAPATALGA